MFVKCHSIGQLELSCNYLPISSPRSQHKEAINAFKMVDGMVIHIADTKKTHISISQFDANRVCASVKYVSLFKKG